MNDDLRTEPGGEGFFDEPIALGATMGRYQLRALVGAGGMGVVFEALDPELDRSVAVKVLRGKTGQGSEGEARLRREGQTMARLTHPNVIRVYDVGVSHGHLFVAMEFIAGGTLADWLEAAPRTATEILTVFVHAGRGLAAAHRAGLVHRDFKPSNVLVSRDDGRVLVTDFGLARPASDTGGGGHGPTSATIDPASLGVAATLTRAGTFVGTPGYMAPEQYNALPIDARADQFSFCVALWRGLFGTAPYDGRTVEELAASTGSGELTPPPPGASSRVSPAIRAALERGLKSDPSLRFPAMDDLLAVIEPKPSRKKLYAGIAIGGAIVVGAVAWSVLAGRSSPDPCPAPDAQVAAVWGDARKAALRDRLTTVDPASGPGRFAAAAAVLDRGVPAWREMHVGACRATRVDGTQSDTLLDARMRCLTDWIDGAGAAVKGLETAADPGALEGAIKGVSSLAPLARCADLVALQAASQLPTAPAEHAEAVAILDETKAVNAARKSGNREGLVERADVLVARARKLDHPATLAKVLAVRWRISLHGGDFAAAIEFLHEVTEVAARGHDDREAALAWSLMGRLTAMTQGKPEQAKVMMNAARAAVARAGDDPDLAVQVLIDHADVLNAAGDGPGALKNLAEARGLLAKLGAAEPGSPHTAKLASLLQTESNVHWFADAHDAAVPPLREAIQLYDRAYGPDTLDSAAAHLDLAQVLMGAMKLDEAEAAVDVAVRIRQMRAGESATLAMALIVRADIMRARGDRAAGLEVAERSLAIARTTMPADDGELIYLTFKLASHYDSAGKLKQALALYTDGLAAVERTGMMTINVGGWWLERADIERRLGNCRDAIAHFKKGGEVARGIDGDETYFLGGALRGEAQCLVETGKKAEAIERLEASLAYKVPPFLVADAALSRGVLGMLLADTGRDRARGLALARESLAQVKAANDPMFAADPRLKQLETWLAKQR
jgi:tetratricopeptide (TPR) repeat protein